MCERNGNLSLKMKTVQEITQCTAVAFDLIKGVRRSTSISFS